MKRGKIAPTMTMKEFSHELSAPVRPAPATMYQRLVVSRRIRVARMAVVKRWADTRRQQGHAP